MYKLMDTAICNICSSGCKPKSWELNYPALAFLLSTQASYNLYCYSQYSLQLTFDFIFSILVVSLICLSFTLW